MTAVRELLATNTPEMADELVLVWRDNSDGGTLAEGMTLAVRAQTQAVEPGRSSRTG